MLIFQGVLVASQKVVLTICVAFSVEFLISYLEVRSIGVVGRVD